MAESQGVISYTIDIETAKMLKAEAVIDKSLDKVVKEFDKADKAVREFTKTQKTLGNTVNKMGQVIDKNSVIVEDLTNNYRKLATTAGTEFKNINTAITKSAKGVNKAVGGMGRNAGMAGIQFQQFIGQVQGGQSVMLALSQQGADLGIVLGAPLLGAVIGITASLAGMGWAMFNTTEKTKDFKFNVNELTKELKMLEGLSKAQVQIAINDINKAMGDLNKDAEKSGKIIAKLNAALDSNTKSVRGGRGARQLSSDQRKKIIEQQLQERANLDDINKRYKIQSDALVELTTNKKGIVTETVKQNESLKSLTQSLEAQAFALQNDEEATFRWVTAQQLGMKSGEVFSETIDKQISKIFELKRAKDRTSAATAFATGKVSGGMSEEQKLQRDMDQLVRDKALTSITLFEEAKTAIEDKQSKLRGKIKDDEAKLAVSAQNQMESAVIGFLSSTTSAILSGMDEQSGAYKAMFAIQKGLQVASIIMNAHSGATAALSPVTGLGPVLGKPLSAAILGMGYASAGIVAGTALAGGREHGGSVSAGNTYRTGENNKPEILQAGNQLLEIAGDGGKVFNQNQLNQIGGGGQSVNVSVNVENNVSGANVSTSSSDDGRIIKIVINEVANQLSTGQGIIPRSLKQSTNTKFKA